LKGKLSLRRPSDATRPTVTEMPETEMPVTGMLESEMPRWLEGGSGQDPRTYSRAHELISNAFECELTRLRGVPRAHAAWHVRDGGCWCRKTALQCACGRVWGWRCVGTVRLSSPRLHTVRPCPGLRLHARGWSDVKRASRANESARYVQRSLSLPLAVGVLFSLAVHCVSFE
jgi:hypothetical protein